MILDVILNFHAWSSSRPEYETAIAGDTLLDETQRVMATEEEQGMSLFSFGMDAIIQLSPPSTSDIASPFHSIAGIYLTFVARIYSS